MIDCVKCKRSKLQSHFQFWFDFYYYYFFFPDFWLEMRLKFCRDAKSRFVVWIANKRIICCIQMLLYSKFILTLDFPSVDNYLFEFSVCLFDFFVLITTFISFMESFTGIFDQIIYFYKIIDALFSNQYRLLFSCSNVFFI